MALDYKVIIGPKDAPILSFGNEAMVSWDGDFAVDLVGDELSVDEAHITILQAEESAELYVPADYDEVVSSDGYLYATSRTLDETRIYDVPYGTAVRIYSGEELVTKLYLESVERVGKSTYRIRAISFIGLLEKKQHVGNVYSGILFPDLLDEILSFTTEDINPRIEDDIRNVMIFGWLPIATARENLHQLLFATGVSITRGEDGDPVFSYIYDVLDNEIPSNRIFVDGTIKYPVPSTAVEVTEHQFIELSTDDEVTLFDNTDTAEPLDHALVTFDDAPIHSLAALSTGFTIHTAHPNYAIISGIGTLVGKKYTHTKQIISRSSETDHVENLKKAENCTLISVANSENVADRMMAYYSVSKTVNADIVLDGERCGRKYSFTDMYDEINNAFLATMSINASAFLRAECEMLSGYVPTGQGNNYNHAVVLTGSGVWWVPDEVLFNEDGTRKETARIRVVVIGGGDGGEAGDRGQDAVVEMDDGEVVSSGIDNDGFGGMPVGWEKVGTSAFSGGLWMPRASGGQGGAGGAGGTPGKILTRTIDVAGVVKIAYACGTGGRGGTVRTTYGNLNEYKNYDHHGQQKTAPGSGTHTTFGDPENPLLDSDDGATSTYGYLNVFDGQRYGAPGIDGVAGGDGGDYVAGKGEDVTFNGQTWTGGKLVKNGQPEAYGLTDRLSDEENYYGGAGGGAAVGANGSPGGSYRQFTLIWREVNGSGTVTDEREMVWRNVYGNGGDGGNAVKGTNGANYGAGGNGGHGGGGGGATGFGYVLNSTHYGSGYGYFTHTLNDYLLVTKNSRTGDTEYENLTKAQTRFGYGGDGGNGGRGGDGCVIIFY